MKKYIASALFSATVLFWSAHQERALAYGISVNYLCGHEVNLAVHFLNYRTGKWETLWYQFTSNEFGKDYNLVSGGEDLNTKKI